MKKSFLIILLLAGLISCGDNHSHEQHSHEAHNQEATEHHHDCDEHDHEHEHEEAEEIVNGIKFTEEQSQKIDFATEVVDLQPLNQVIKTTAQVVPSQESQKIINATANGIVSFSDKNLVSGKEVKAGQVLFSIESGDMADGNMSLRKEEIKAEFERAKAEFERKQTLAKDKIVSESDLLQAKTDFVKAEKAYQNMENNFPNGKQLVKAPTSGFVNSIKVPNGAYVDAGQAVMTITKSNALYLKAELQPKYYSVLKDVKDANIRTLNNNLSYSLTDLSGRMISYGKSADLNNPLIPVTFEIQNTADLLPGSFVEMYILTESDRLGVMVPNTAVVEEMGTYCVFVQHEPELYEKRLIEKGATDGINTQIINGLEAGERIVTKGAVNVKLAQGSAALDPHAGHAH